VICCLGSPLLYTLSETTVIGIGISKKTSFALVASVLAFLLNFVLSYLLIPIYGSKGAAASTCLSFLLFFVLRTEFSIFLWRHTPRVGLYFYTFAVVIGAVFNTLWGHLIPSAFLVYWIIVLLSCLFYFKQELSLAYSKLWLRLKSTEL
jgi:O-antigen/teichoic acid export membrane protein